MPESTEQTSPIAEPPAGGSAAGQAVDSSAGSTPATETPTIAQRNLLGRRVMSQPAPIKATPTRAADPAQTTSVPSVKPTPAEEEPEPAVAEEESEPAVAEGEPEPAVAEEESKPAAPRESGARRSDADLPVPSRSVLVRPDDDGSDALQANVEPTASSPFGSGSAKDVGENAELPEDGSLLFTRQSPILSVETMGPRRIMVGKESAYAVTLRNSGQVAADQVVVTVALPDWADVLGTEMSKGTAVSPEPGGTDAGVRWDIGRVGAKEAEKLALRIVPRQSQPFDLAVQWDYTPAVSQAMIEVQEPKLEMRLEGPREVLFGQSEVYRLELANSGTGDAEEVEITLMPIGTGEGVPATHKVGTIEAGQKKAIEVELTARQTGTLTIQVDARGDGGVVARVAHEVAVRRPALAIEVQAPSLQYVGTDATCLIRVSNPGTASAENVAVTATIPPGAEYVSSTAEGRLATDQKTVTWALENLDVGAETTLELTCNLGRPGLSRLEVTSSAAGGLTASREATVRVEAIADLELDVVDPAGPIPVDSEAIYQVRVRNRGTKSAEQVEVVAYFSHGIEPTAAEGGRYQTSPGQVAFESIPSLAAGKEVSLKIKAKAEAAGNHVCRVEVYCKPLGARLVSEETTYFYGGPGAAKQGPTSQSANVDSPVGDQPIRTADQRPTPAPPKGE
jgi:uncharacterized repeat protein (TIGR01451 family)